MDAAVHLHEPLPAERRGAQQRLVHPDELRVEPILLVHLPCSTDRGAQKRTGSDCDRRVSRQGFGAAAHSPPDPTSQSRRSARARSLPSSAAPGPCRQAPAQRSRSSWALCSHWPSRRSLRRTTCGCGRCTPSRSGCAAARARSGPVHKTITQVTHKQGTVVCLRLTGPEKVPGAGAQVFVPLSPPLISTPTPLWLETRNTASATKH